MWFKFADNNDEVMKESEGADMFGPHPYTSSQAIVVWVLIEIRNHQRGGHEWSRGNDDVRYDPSAYPWGQQRNVGTDSRLLFVRPKLCERSFRKRQGFTILPPCPSPSLCPTDKMEAKCLPADRRPDLFLLGYCLTAHLSVSCLLC